MSDSPTPETDAMEAHKDEAVWRSVVPSKFSRRLERERDGARRDLVAAEELHRRRFGTLKAEYDAVCTRFAEAERERDDALKEWDIARDGWNKALEERDEARRELAEALQMLSVWHGAVSQMKKQLRFAPPFHQGTDSQEESK